MLGDKYLRPYITCVPEITVLARQKDDEFIVMASDGLWDVVTNADIVKMVKDVFNKYYILDIEQQVLHNPNLVILKAVLKFYF